MTQQHELFATIADDDLADVTGAGIYKWAERGYRWWVKNKRHMPSPKEMFDETINVLKGIGYGAGLVAGAGVGGKLFYDWATGHNKPPAYQEDAPTTA